MQHLHYPSSKARPFQHNPITNNYLMLNISRRLSSMCVSKVHHFHLDCSPKIPAVRP